MTDLLERLAAANPVPEAEKPPIEDLWRKVSELDGRPRRGRGVHRSRSGRWVGRGVFASIAVAVPIIVVAAIAIPLLGADHTISHPAATRPSHHQLTINPAAQRIAARQLGGRVGAVVAVDPRTGAISGRDPLVRPADRTRRGDSTTGTARFAGIRPASPPTSPGAPVL